MIRHHPSAELLADYARGTLDPGARLTVACHIHDCVICRSEAALWEGVGGAVLETLDPTPLSEGALEKTLARLGNGTSTSVPQIPAFMRSFAVPSPLAREKIGFRRWVTPSIWFAPIHLGKNAGSYNYLVYARAGTTLAQHTHGGAEYTQVLHGSFRDDTGTFEQGDFACTDENILHAPAVTLDSDCLCLSSSDEPMQLTGRAARIVQSLLGTLY
jgi:putative transcriptional regulator